MVFLDRASYCFVVVFTHLPHFLCLCCNSFVAVLQSMSLGLLADIKRSLNFGFVFAVMIFWGKTVM